MKNFTKRTKKAAISPKSPNKRVKKFRNKAGQMKPKKTKSQIEYSPEHGSSPEISESDDIDRRSKNEISPVNNDESDINVEESNEELDNDEDDMNEEKHKQSLNKLKETDPEFYQYLQQNDQSLLDFGDSASDDDADGEMEGVKNEKIHKLPESLEVASDESDYETSEKQDGKTNKVTLAMIEEWESDLKSNKRSVKALSIAVKAFHAALLRATGDEDTSDCVFKIDGASVFNGVVQMCVSWLYPYLEKCLNLPSKSVTKKHVLNAKQWPRMKTLIRTYLIDLTKLIGNVTSADVLSVLLKHLHQMVPLAASLPTIVKSLLKRIIGLWSSNPDDTVRVVAFLCILRLVASDLSSYLHNALKMLYVSYISNSKFMSPNTLPGINFMRKSLTEMFSLNETVSYNHAFLYIRQLAIHLRSAVTLKKKDSIQTVYNWQYMASLRLWVDILCANYDKTQLNTLVYPTIQIIIGCIKLVPTAQYLPIRFHCIQLLTKFTKETGVFIPVLPFVIEALTILNVNTEHKKLSMKPMDLSCVLRLSKAQLQENAFKDAIIEYVYESILEYTTAESHRISFPDTIVPLVIQLKQFLKDCKNNNYSRKLKPLLDKIEETSKLMNEARSKCGIVLIDSAAIAAWESNAKLKSNPLAVFYESWLKLRKQQTARKFTDNIKLSEFNLPEMKKPSKTVDVKKRKKTEDGKLELFSSSDEDDTDIKFGSDNDEVQENISTEVSQKKDKRKVKSNVKRTKKKRKISEKEASDEPEADDVVENFSLKKFLA